MHYQRVIPCLDVDAGRVVKGTNFVDIRDAGDPVELAERYDVAGGRTPTGRDAVEWARGGRAPPRSRACRRWR